MTTILIAVFINVFVTCIILISNLDRRQQVAHLIKKGMHDCQIKQRV